jgi:lysophospholipase
VSESKTGAFDVEQVALTTSGGGYRSLLSGAGVIQGLDSRDSDVSTSGLYQALTYQAGLSGGSWLLSSMAGNNYPTITYLKEILWKQAFQDSLADPAFLLVAIAYAEIIADVFGKEAAGYRTTLTDPWGRLLSCQLLSGPYGGVSTTLSSVSSLSSFTSYSVPFPVITSLGSKVWLGDCVPGPNATTYEFTPYEFGSWDSDVRAFTPTKYLGTPMSGGRATGKCTTNYDNLGYILGTSSNLFNNVCFDVPVAENSSTNLDTTLAQIINDVHELTTEDLYATYKNPFYNYISSTATPNIANNISAQENLSLVDGGEALQNNPIFPLLQPARNVSVILVNDNSNDAGGWPNGTEILTTYVQSFNHGLTRMPFIPSVETFISQGLNKRATFFGCNATDKIMIVYLPNNEYTFASNTSTYQLEYSETETDEMVANGVGIATQGGDSAWGTCLGCAIMMKTGQPLPSDCTACFAKYCYYD